MAQLTKYSPSLYSVIVHHTQNETIIHGDNMARSDALKQAQKKYRAKAQEQLNLTLSKGTKAKIQQLSMLSGESMASYVLEAIRQRAQRDGHADILAAGSDRDGNGETETDGSTEEDRE